jgi:hypothetical protein
VCVCARSTCAQLSITFLSLRNSFLGWRATRAARYPRENKNRASESNLNASEREDRDSKSRYAAGIKNLLNREERRENHQDITSFGQYIGLYCLIVKMEQPREPLPTFQLSKEDKDAMAHMRFAQGLGASLRYANELRAVQQPKRLFLKSSNLHEEVLRGYK